MDDKEFLTVGYVASLLDVHDSSVYRWIRLGEGPRVLRTPGGRIRIARGDLDAWLEAQRGAPRHDG
ncbi:helix-turn-helix domain-containing protein [Spiractinospora alimapuensis]|uniref:helix-turn-helix domain-containing protein n=1 Tax=Spiractinospora alimapuensis TaxID=2820884 RepID=UPI001F3D9060|nr:helix-turn-helix domain-containing protein [Spiractinospora alimapuensis]QVQ53720.1 helix-turn-helix domain-containing protein [Spiractinospora alimapuensis]